MAVKPPILRAGDTIGVVSLGSPLSSALIEARVQTLRNMGFEVLVGSSAYAADGYLAGSPGQRAADFMRMIENPKVRLILPARGGVGVAAVLPLLNYTTIARNPKIVTGYSDITILLNVLSQFVGLITFHSLLLLDFTPSEPLYNFNQFYAATASTAAPRVIDNPPGLPLIGRVGGNVTGPVVGGNLTSFADAIGTPYEIETRGKILLLEETHEPINKVYRMMNRLVLAGKFRDCLGIVMGECSQCPPAYGKSYADLINEVLVPLGKPLLTNLASGHGYYKAAIPIGATVNLNATESRLTVTESTVRV
ncbi:MULTISPECIES: S66 peptidase family protein [Paenibacillus]|uniref:S66 peptidase family protein n=1 Tax=Paenibacillus TaxID=44249 RepID=UPI0022B92E36|nr:LD-carboxypeptidase [Paenibacillus caseinilyticus]MCZ8520388.1 LD-carboxypeptidase [Paenibacillus caseinilyticus]